MAIKEIPVDQRVIDVDSRRFAVIEKALVELITNSDDSYSRLEKTGDPVSGRIAIAYERHQGGALLVVTDEAEGLSFPRACQVLAYGGAHSPLARGERGGRGYFGRGLKQAIYGLGHGWIETIHHDRLSRIELFRAENGGYLYDDGGGDRPATAGDRQRLGIADGGTRVSIVVDNPLANIPHHASLAQALGNNIYLREILARRQVELTQLRHGSELEKSALLRYEAPRAADLLGPEHAALFVHAGEQYPFTITLKRALDAELTTVGDERSNGLLVVSGSAVLDCQFFDFEKQLGTEYLFGTVSCPALIEKLGDGLAVISDEREGLNRKDPFVAAFAHAVSRLLAPFVLAEREKLKHLARASISGRTGQMIEQLLERMSRAALQDLGLPAPGADTVAAGNQPAALRFSTPFYYRKPGHPFHVALLVDPGRFAQESELRFDYVLPDSLRIDPEPVAIPLSTLNDGQRIEWSVTGETAGERGEITVRAGDYWAWCEIVIAEHAVGQRHAAPAHFQPAAPAAAPARSALSRDHGLAMFAGYEFRNLANSSARAIYSREERKIIINTGAPTVQLYVDGHGHFRDSARLLLAELFMDVIADELARRKLERSGRKDDIDAYHAAKLELVRRYGSEIHQVFIGTAG
ncbi:ATP-binding protein [Rhodocyclus purpureus]|uniref:ATP-binding protein n=1 Tax=Rhodocyclus purpureus TaxID=1067 RepID=UPI00191359B3|nr:ATP-binding protein [Rhodocyclus purpureus]MBK5913034.1 ATP-binding protein [Rhodocyclus purpureus]